ncbi:MAG: GH3 auxin-responsive promoter family protein [Bacteroidia bacterium]|nr:GH3 auxin-responsive promoter family protein [Bacteroidia bacterium]
MPLIGALIKQGLKLGTRVKLREVAPAKQQFKELKKLLTKAEETSFGRHYNFSEILANKNLAKHFQENVPVFNYSSIYEKWWHRCLKEEEDICWPGHVKYFALSSGTSDSASKHIPVTSDMIRALRKASIRQILTLGKYDLPSAFFEKGILWLGGSTDLNQNGGYYEGDVSGISARRVPIWFQRYYKPGNKISKEKDWNIKLEEITLQAKNWDIGIITGVPAWIQILLEKVISHYKLKTIHDIWPNLRIYAHGGVSFEPYKNSFAKYFSSPVYYIEMYPASEGFIAFQADPDTRSMKLILNNGIYYEFIPFNDANFNEAGEPKENAKALTINEVQKNVDYALLISTCAGAWRYLIGDVIRFTDTENCEIIITGRTKHFLSLVGEHLSVDNMNQAIAQVATEFKIDIREYTVSGIPYDGTFAHQWYIGADAQINEQQVKIRLDSILKELNDDYAVERGSALKDIFVKTVPVEKFYGYMNSKGKLGGQNKFPRVLKSSQLEEWKLYLENGSAH